MKTNKVITSLSTNKDLLDKFIAYYSTLSTTISFNSFIFYSLDIQLGILLRFFEDEYNMCISATCSFYYITYAHPLKDEEKIKANNSISIADWSAKSIKEVNKSCIKTYEMAIIKAIDLNQIF